VADLVAGDVYVVQGQSNAVAQQFSGDANVNQGPFLRSFGTRTSNAATTAADTTWYVAEGNQGFGPGAVGQWSLRLGRLLIDAHQVPIAIVNGAHGGQPITFFQRNDGDPEDLATNYGRLLTRMRVASLADGVRAILFYQGESDQSDATGHHDGWIALREDWLEDYPTVERFYVTQIRRGCGGAVELREVQRGFADTFANVSVMSTTGLDGHDGCHYAYEVGYAELGERYAALLTRDLYGGDDSPDIDAPNPETAAFSNPQGTQIVVTVRDAASTLSWDQGAHQHFALEGSSVVVTGGSASGAQITLELSGDGSGASGLRYIGHPGPGPWVRNATGVGLLAFAGLSIAAN